MAATAEGNDGLSAIDALLGCPLIMFSTDLLAQSGECSLGHLQRSRVGMRCYCSGYPPDAEITLA